MKTIEYRWIDKSAWDRGPWDQEPDKVQWLDLETGLPCMVLRSERIGSWCGYVGVFEGHPWFEKKYCDEQVDIRCHGGLTYSDFCHDHNKVHGICHLVEPGEPDRVWWFGFDCAHAFDVTPGIEFAPYKILKGWPRYFYRSLAYVQRECVEIARQLNDHHRKWQTTREDVIDTALRSGPYLNPID